MADAKKLVVSLGADISGVKKAMGEVKKSVSDTTGGITKQSKGLLSGFSSIAGGLGKIALATGAFKLVSAGIDLITSSVGDAISRVDTLNQFPKVLQQMGYSAEDAEASINTLSDGIQGLPTTLNEIASTTQRLTNVFGDVGVATDTALALNNAFLASGASSEEASRGMAQYTQMLSSGKVDMESWKTLQETMPYALQATAEAFGYTGKSAQNDFYKALQSGDVTMDEFNTKIVELSEGTGGFAEVAKEATKGIQTSWSNIKTAITTGVANIISAFDEWLESKGFGGISGVLDKIKEAVKSAFSYVLENVPVVLDAFSSFFSTIANSTAFQTLKDVIVSAFDTAMTAVTGFGESTTWQTIKNVLAEIGQAILDINFSEIVSQLGEFLEKWTPLIAGIVAGIAVFQGLTFVAGVITAISTAGGILALVMGAISIAGGILAGVFAFITSPITLVALAIGALIAICIALWQNWDIVKEKGAMLKDKLVSDFEELKNLVVGTITTLKDSVLADFEELKNLGIGAVNTLKTSAIEDFNELSALGKGATKTLKDSAVADFNELKTGASNIIKTLKASAIADFLELKNGAINLFNLLKNGLVSKVNEIKVNAGNGFLQLKSSVIEKISSTVSAVKTKFNEVVSAISTPINKAKNAVKTAVDAMKGFFNFSWKLPSIKMPHFSVSGSANPIDWIKQGVPKLNVNWYKTGGIATGASVVGVGEAGDEAIVPLSNKTRMKPFAEAISSMMPNQGNNDNGGSGDVIITGNTLIVREEADIKRVAQELKKLEDKERRPKGKRG